MLLATVQSALEAAAAAVAAAGQGEGVGCLPPHLEDHALLQVRSGHGMFRHGLSSTHGTCLPWDSRSNLNQSYVRLLA